MALAVRLREDYDAGQLRALAKASRDATQTRRLLALAAIYEPISGSWSLAGSANPCKRNGMSTDRAVDAPHPAGEQPLVEYGKERSVIADTFAGRVHMEWEAGERAAMPPLGQLPFFIEYLNWTLALLRGAGVRL